MSQARTPGTVISAAVVMFIYGGLLLVCVACGGVALAAQPPDQMGLQAALDKDAPGHKIVPIVVMVFNFLFAAALIGAGLGVLWLNQLARYATYAACLLILLTTCVSTGYNAFVVSPVTERVVKQHMDQQLKGQGAAPMDMGAFMVGGRVLGIVIAIGIPLLFCTPIVILLSLGSARDAFAGKFPEDPEEKRRRRYDGYDDEDDDYGRPAKSPESPGDTGIKE